MQPCDHPLVEVAKAYSFVSFFPFLVSAFLCFYGFMDGCYFGRFLF